MSNQTLEVPPNSPSRKKQEPIQYYYLRDNQNKPVVTVCLIQNNDNVGWARGISICSPQDNPRRDRGRALARRRALIAIESRTPFYLLPYRLGLLFYFFQTRFIESFSSEVVGELLAILNITDSKFRHEITTLSWVGLMKEQITSYPELSTPVAKLTKREKKILNLEEN